MARFLLRRLVLAVLVCFTVLVLSFALTRVAGDPAVAVAGPQATAEDIAAIRTAYGLDRPLPQQFLSWVAAAAGGDLGRSYLYRAPVGGLIRTHLPVTLVLGLVGLSFAVLVALPQASIVLKHAARNAAMPVVAIAAVQLGFMLGGSIVIESVFSLPGLGFLAWESISKNDFPVVQAVVLLLAVIYIALTLLADLLNAVLDPRLRMG